MLANEKRLIPLRKRIIYAGDLWQKTFVCDEVAEVRKFIEQAPTVDAVEVVRCKDCTQWGGVAFGNVCRRWSAPLVGMKNCTGPEDFCSCGERRTE